MPNTDASKTANSHVRRKQVGLSQAAACDGNLYSIAPASDQGKALPNTGRLSEKNATSRFQTPTRRPGLDKGTGQNYGLFVR